MNNNEHLGCKVQLPVPTNAMSPSQSFGSVSFACKRTFYTDLNIRDHRYQYQTPSTYLGQNAARRAAH